MGRYRTATELSRADVAARPWLRWVGVAVGLLAAVPGLPAILLISVSARPRRRS